MGFLDWLFGRGGGPDRPYVRRETAEVIDGYDLPRRHFAPASGEAARIVETLERATGIEAGAREFPVDPADARRVGEAAVEAIRGSCGVDLGPSSPPEAFDRLLEDRLVDPSLQEAADDAAYAEGREAARIPDSGLLYFALGAAWGEWLRANRAFEWLLVAPLDPVQAFDDMGAHGWMTFMHPFSHVTKKLIDPRKSSFAGRGHAGLQRQMGPPPRALLACPADSEEAYRRLVGGRLMAAAVPGLHKAAALEFAREALAERPDSPLVAFHVSEMARGGGDWKLAEECLRKVWASHETPRHAFHLANAILETGGSDDEVLGLLERAVQLDPGFWQAYLLRASLLHSLGRVPEAEAVRDALLAANPPAEYVAEAKDLFADTDG